MGEEAQRLTADGAAVSCHRRATVLCEAEGRTADWKTRCLDTVMCEGWWWSDRGQDSRSWSELGRLSELCQLPLAVAAS